jgi:hypothetical protein
LRPCATRSCWWVGLTPVYARSLLPLSHALSQIPISTPSPRPSVRLNPRNSPLSGRKSEKSGQIRLTRGVCPLLSTPRSPEQDAARAANLKKVCGTR